MQAEVCQFANGDPGQTSSSGDRETRPVLNHQSSVLPRHFRFNFFKYSLSLEFSAGLEFCTGISRLPSFESTHPHTNTTLHRHHVQEPNGPVLGSGCGRRWRILSVSCGRRCQGCEAGDEEYVYFLPRGNLPRYYLVCCIWEC